MASQWYYARNGQKYGPITSAQLTNLAKTGQLLPSDLIWKDGMPQWVAAGRSAQLFPAAQGVASHGVAQGSMNEAVHPAVVVRQALSGGRKRKYRGLTRGVQALVLIGALIGTGYYALTQPMRNDVKPRPTRPATPSTPLNPSPPAADVETADVEERDQQEKDTPSPPPTPEQPQQAASENLNDHRPLSETAADVKKLTKPVVAPWSPAELQGLAELLGVTPSPPPPLAAVFESRKKNDSNPLPLLTLAKSPRAPLLLEKLQPERDMPSKVRVWNPTTGLELTVVSTDDATLYCPMVFSPNGSRVVSLDGQYLRLWSVDAATLTHVGSCKTASTRDISPILYWTDAFVMMSTESLSRPTRTLMAWAVEGNELSDGLPCQEPTLINNVAGPIAASGALLASSIWTDRDRDQTALVISDARTAKPLASIPLAAPTQALTHPEPLDGYYSLEENLRSGSRDPRTCFMFVADGDRLLVSTVNHIGILDTKKRKPLSAITVPQGAKVACVDPMGNYIALLTAEAGVTAASTSVVCKCSVHNLKDGTIVCEIQPPEWVRKYAVKQKVGDNLNKRVVPTSESMQMRFSDDGKTLTAIEVHSNDVGVDYNLPPRWVESTEPLNIQINIDRWSIPEGTSVGHVSAVLGEPSDSTPAGQRRGRYCSADVRLVESSIALLQLFSSNMYVDVDSTIELSEMLQTSDEAWMGGKYDEAWQGYRKLLVHPMRWLFASRLGQLIGRGVDAVATSGDTEKSVALLAWCRDHGLAVNCETSRGQAILAEWAAAEAERIAKEDAELRLAREKELQERQKRFTEMRERNRQKAVPSRRLTKREFIDVLRNTMDRGRIDDQYVQAIFEGYSFQDVIGEPDSDADFDGVRRLYHYKCKDGMCQLTVIISGPIVTVTAINRF